MKNIEEIVQIFDNASNSIEKFRHATTCEIKLNMTVKVIAKGDKDEFEKELQNLLNDGFKIISSNCGFINSELYDFADYYQAILVKE